jgi:hypothetical protein
MVRVAGMAVELLATNRPAPLEVRTPPAPQPFIPPQPSVSPPSRHASTQPFTYTPPAPSSSHGVAQAVTSDSSSAPDANNSSAYTPAPPPPPHAAATMVSSPDATEAAHAQSAAPEANSFADLDATHASPQADTAANATTGALDETSSPAAVNAGEAATAPPTFVETPGQPSPLGTARTYGRSGAQTDLPVEVVGEEERRFHNEARRFARLLVSEIKLYNEQKVREGRAGADLYARLTEEIDRSREMYDKRVRPEVAASYDYFHAEVVNTLAEGDDAKLGDGYPGAMVS